MYVRNVVVRAPLLEGGRWKQHKFEVCRTEGTIGCVVRTPISNVDYLQSILAMLIRAKCF